MSHNDEASVSPQPSHESEERLFIRQIITERSIPAFDTLTERYRQPLGRFLTQQTNGDRAAAEDLLQETFLRLWTRADGFDYHGTVHAWLFRVAANLAANHRRTRLRRRETAQTEQRDVENTPALGPEEILLRAEQNAHVRHLIASLPEPAQELLRLVHDEEFGLREVASALGIPEGTVKSRLYHTRRRLAEKWDKEE